MEAQQQEGSPSPKQEKGEVAKEKISREWKQDVVNRTNKLFVRLGITAQPIRTFEELQRSASSMFVGIFETMFNLRLKSVIRTPRMVTEYIANAQLVMTALSESLSIDLSHITGEDIYYGHPEYINQLLTLFEGIWLQLFEEQPEADDIRMKMDITHSLHEQRNPNKTQGPVFDEEYQSLSDSLLNSPSFAIDVETPGGNESNFKVNKTKRVKTKSIRKKREKTGSKKSTAKKAVKRKPVVPRQLHSKENRPLSQKPVNYVRAKHKGKQPLNLRKDMHGENAENTETEKIKKRLTKIGVGLLAKKYPALYQDVLKKRAKTAMKKTQVSESNTLVEKMNMDLNRHKETYKILLKQQETEARKQMHLDRRRARAALQSLRHEKKVESIKNSKTQMELKRRQHSRALRRETQEEVLVRRMFNESLKFEHQKIIEQERAKVEASRKANEEQLNRYESMERYLTDQEEMLKESLDQQNRAERLSRYEQRAAFRQLEAEIKKDYLSKLRIIQGQWDQQNEKNALEDHTSITEAFAGMNDYVADIAAKNVRQTLKESVNE